jgi:HEAT repeat protein
MRRSGVLLPLVLLFAVGCQRSTTSIIDDLKSPDSGTRLKAARTLGQRRDDAARVIPALTEALQDDDAEVRRSVAYSLGTFREQAKDAIPALEACLGDRDAGVREAAGIALEYIDPNRRSSES